MNDEQVRHIVEAALMAAGRPLSIDTLIGLFGDEARPDRGQIRGALNALIEQYQDRGIELVEVASGFRIQVRQNMSDWLSRLWQERPPRYSRALMETLALIAYRQPITRGEIEDVRGVAVSTNIVRTLMERGWIRVVGHRDVPGKPAMFGTTREFLDYFGLKRLDELPSLAELRDLDSLNVELDLGFEVPGAESDTPEAGREEHVSRGEVRALVPQAPAGAMASPAEEDVDAAHDTAPESGQETAPETGQDTAAESGHETGQDEHPNAGRA